MHVRHTDRPVSLALCQALTLLLGAACPAASDGRWRHPCVGRDGAALASCFGWNATDATDALHAAFGSGAASLTIDNVNGQPWLVRPLHLANVSGLRISLAAGVTILAKQDEFHGLDDCLLRLTNLSDVVLSSEPGSSLRMRRDDYAIPSRGSCPSCRPYRKAEWRMGIWLDASAVNVRLENLHVTDSGGDGLFVYGARNVTVQDCVFERHYRQGMSIISADGLLVERTVFALTNGTAPSAGIDIEPDRASNQLKNVELRDVVLLNNAGGGFMINAGQLNSSTDNISIDVSNMTVRGSAGVGIAVGNIVGVGGHIAISATRILNTIGCGLAVYRKDVSAATLVLNNVHFSSVALGVAGSGKTGCAPQGPCSPVILMGGWDPPYTVDVGGFSVSGTIEDSFARPFLIGTDPGYSLVDAKFELTVDNPHGCKSELQKNSSGVDVDVTCHASVSSPVQLKSDDTAACPLPTGSCCGNTTWSAFAWRALVTASVAFTLDGLLPPPAAPEDSVASVASVAAASSSAVGTNTVCLANKKFDGCTNATESGSWSSWHEFSAAAAQSLCGQYPNINDPSIELMIAASVTGIAVGNMSTMTLEIQPRGARAQHSSYLLNATVTPTRQLGDGGTNFAPAWRVLTPSIYLVLSAENHTEQPPITTGKSRNLQYYSAMPAARAAPRRISILQEYHGHDDVGANIDAAIALHEQLGASALRVAGASAALQEIVSAVGVPFVGGRLVRKNQTSSSPIILCLAAVGLVQSDTDLFFVQAAPCNHTRCKTDHSFPNATSEQDVDNMLRAWAKHWVSMMKSAGTNMSALRQLEMYDEIGWEFPTVFAGEQCYYAKHGCFNVTLNARVLKRFHAYIQQQSGFAKPSAFGATTWDDIIPLTNLTAIESGTNAQLKARQRILFYWSIRFAAWDVETYYARVVAAVTQANHDEPVGAFLNANNFHGRLYEPLGKVITVREVQDGLPVGPMHRRRRSRSVRVEMQGSTAGATAKGGIDWFEAGRFHTGDILWTEDWFGDDYASEWSYLSNRLRSAARLAQPRIGSAGTQGSPVTFGGAIVPRAGTDGRKANKTGSSVGTPDLLMRALTLVGNGAKHIWWFAFGPEKYFPGNCFSEEAIGAIPTYPGKQNATQSLLFAQIATASNMIAGADDLLFEGEMPFSPIAILYPRSSWMWDTVNGSDHDDHDTDEDQGETEMDYQAEVYGLFRAIAQYSNRQVDFIDEDSLTADGLAPYKALIVTEPNVPTTGQEAILDWCRLGGHLATVSGAMASDRYDEPSTALSSATGVDEAPRPRVMDTSHQGHQQKEWFSLVHNASGELGQLSAYVIRSHFTSIGPRSAVLATFDKDKSPAVVRTDVGHGQITQFGFMPTTPFPFMDAYDPSPDFNRGPIDGSIPYLLDFLDQAGAAPRVNVTDAAEGGTQVMRVETPLLVSDRGAVLTVLNWRTRAIPPAEQLPLRLHVSVRVDLKGKATIVDSVSLGRPLDFTCTPLHAAHAVAGSTDGKTTYLVRFEVDVTYGDFIRIIV